jgi:acyl-CoA thioesterase FadM
MTAVSQHQLFEVQLALSVQKNEIVLSEASLSSVYTQWFQELRSAILSRYWVHSNHLRDTCIPVLEAIVIEHLQTPSTLNGLTGKIWIAELGYLRWKLYAEIYCDSELIATATQIGLHRNRFTQCPASTPEELFREYWEYRWSL